MIGIDLTTVLLILGALFLLFLIVDLLFAGGGMTGGMMGGMMQGGAALMGTPYGLGLIVVLVILGLGLIVFGGLR